MAVFSKRIKALKVTSVVEYVMLKNFYSSAHEDTYSIVKWNYVKDELMEHVVRNVRKDTAELVWRDRCDRETNVSNY